MCLNEKAPGLPIYCTFGWSSSQALQRRRHLGPIPAPVVGRREGEWIETRAGRSEGARPRRVCTIAEGRWRPAHSEPADRCHGRDAGGHDHQLAGARPPPGDSPCPPAVEGVFPAVDNPTVCPHAQGLSRRNPVIDRPSPEGKLLAKRRSLERRVTIALQDQD
jgi:hypothetical protein